VIVSVSEPSPAMWAHERGHVAQYRRLGCAFLPLYLLLYARHGYATHPLELAATPRASGA
jgi:hypothetical protein